MSVDVDTFASFLDVLADTLNEPDLPVLAVAARLHLSRSHVDRIVSAVAAEPPAALRRRILLERAAYRLVTTDHDVLRVAIEAGYASHEAFTRAFARAYGRAPSRWRRHPGAFRLDAPNHVHFHPPGGLWIPGSRKVEAMDLLTRMLEHHVWLVQEMLNRADRLSPGQLDAPIEVSVEGIDCDPTLRSLLARLVGQLAMWDATTHDRPYDMAVERDQSIAEMRATLAQAGPAFLGQVRTILDEGRLDETFVDARCDPPQVRTYGGMVAHVLTFAAQRRTLVCGALADAGITDLGAGDPMDWVVSSA